MRYAHIHFHTCTFTVLFPHSHFHIFKFHYYFFILFTFTCFFKLSLPHFYFHTFISTLSLFPIMFSIFSIYTDKPSLGQLNPRCHKQNQNILIHRLVYTTGVSLESTLLEFHTGEVSGKTALVLVGANVLVYKAYIQ